ncbi:MAG: TetR/AcrR family transcriptional regulator [Hyphomicrobiales bacterium]|nr:TetR/AcrR family transcriptional regulator [Hyphomicrobiales bacterium]
MSAIAATLKPRKAPIQERSATTVATLHAAAIQVLIKDGLDRCTTTRVAERAGMSVGSLYQYYPNRDALLAAVLEKHLDAVADAVERACHDLEGMPLASLASGLVIGFLRVKLGDPEGSKALYGVAEGRGGGDLAAKMQARIVAAMSALLASAPDARFDDPVMTSAVAFSALAGPVRLLLKGEAPAGFQDDLQDQLIRLLTAYLQSYSVGRGTGR